LTSNKLTARKLEATDVTSGAWFDAKGVNVGREAVAVFRKQHGGIDR